MNYIEIVPVVSDKNIFKVFYIDTCILEKYAPTPGSHVFDES